MKEFSKTKYSDRRKYVKDVKKRNWKLRQSLKDFKDKRIWRRTKGINTKTLELFKKVQKLAPDAQIGGAATYHLKKGKVSIPAGRRTKQQQRDAVDAGVSWTLKGAHPRGHAFDLSFGGKQSLKEVYNIPKMDNIRKEVQKNDPSMKLKKRISGDPGHFELKSPGIDIEGEPDIEAMKAEREYYRYLEYFN